MGPATSTTASAAAAENGRRVRQSTSTPDGGRRTIRSGAPVHGAPAGAQRSGSGGERTGRGGSKPKAGARDPEQARTRTGTPEEVAACRSSFTGWYLKKLLER